jgi:hypothetical protein
MKKNKLNFADGENGNTIVSGMVCFRSGVYPQGTFTADNVREMVRNYDPAYLEAPLTPDHKQEGEAWGWFKSFTVRELPNGEAEVVGECELLPIGEYYLRAGGYKRRSIEFSRSMELPNGKKGFYITAVSVLGAMTPAVKGMPNLFRAPKGDLATTFKSPDGVEVITFSESPDEEPKPNTKSGNQDPPKNKEKFSMTEEEVKALLAKVEKERAEEAKRFSEVEKLAEESAKQLAEFKERAEKAEREKNLIADESRFNAAIDKNREGVTPAVESILRALFNAAPLDTEQNAKVSFSDNGKTEESTVRGLIFKVIEALPKSVDLGKEPISDGTAVQEAAKKEAESAGLGAIPANPSDPKFRKHVADEIQKREATDEEFRKRANADYVSVFNEVAAATLAKLKQ